MSGLTKVQLAAYYEKKIDELQTEIVRLVTDNQRLREEGAELVTQVGRLKAALLHGEDRVLMGMSRETESDSGPTGKPSFYRRYLCWRGKHERLPSDWQSDAPHHKCAHCPFVGRIPL